MKSSFQPSKRASGIVREQVYIHRAQLRIIEEISYFRKKPKAVVFLEALQLYIGSYKAGEI
jgi:hypothetical protein